MRPASHMPLAAMTMAPERMRVDGHGLLGRPREAQPEGQAPPAHGLGEPADRRIEGLEVGERHRRRLAGEGGVDEDVEAFEHALLAQLEQHHQQFLRAAEGEGGHDDVAAAAVQGVPDRADQLGDGLVHRLVQAVAVGRLHHEDVGAAHRLGIADDGAGGLAEVAGEDDPALASPFPDRGPRRWPTRGCVRRRGSARGLPGGGGTPRRRARRSRSASPARRPRPRRGGPGPARGGDPHGPSRAPGYGRCRAASREAGRPWRAWCRRAAPGRGPRARAAARSGRGARG